MCVLTNLTVIQQFCVPIKVIPNSMMFSSIIFQTGSICISELLGIHGTEA